MILRNKNFLYLWTSQILSQITVNMMNFLLLVRLFTITGSSIATSLLWVSYALPTIFFGPIGAASVDLISRRKILLITNFIQALTIFIYIFTHESSIFLLYIVVIIYSLLNQFYVPAESSSLPSVVPPEKLAQANSLFFVTQQAALVFGFGFGGIVLRFIGFKGSLILSSVFLFIAFISVNFLPKLKPRRSIPKSYEKILSTFFDSIIEGYRFIRRTKYIFFPLLLLLGLQAGVAMVTVSLPTIVTQILKIPVTIGSSLLAIPAGLGAIAGSILIPKLLSRKVRTKYLIESGLLLLGLALILLVFLIPHLSITPRILISSIVVIFLGYGFISTNIPALTYIQKATPLELRGRVFGNLWFFITVLTVFPVIFSGVITEFFGVRSLLSVLAIGSILVFYYSKKRGQALIEEHFSSRDEVTYE